MLRHNKEMENKRHGEVKATMPRPRSKSRSRRPDTGTKEVSELLSRSRQKRWRRLRPNECYYKDSVGFIRLIWLEVIFSKYL